MTEQSDFGLLKSISDHKMIHDLSCTISLSSSPAYSLKYFEMLLSTFHSEIMLRNIETHIFAISFMYLNESLRSAETEPAIKFSEAAFRHVKI